MAKRTHSFKSGRAKAKRLKTAAKKIKTPSKKLHKKTSKAAAKPARASKKAAAPKAKLRVPAAAVAPRKPHVKIEHICGFVRQVAGPQGMKIVECLGDGATDEKIEEKTEMKIAEVRSILNHLHSFGVVEYSREKNMNNGWFTYTWKANPERAMQNYLAMKRREYDGLRKTATSEDGAQHYKCRKGCSKVPFDEAMDLKFRCPKCNSNMVHAAGSVDLTKVEGEIRDIERVLARPEIDGE